MSATKHIVVTGASSGIGAALTRTLAAEGHALYVCARRVEKLSEVTDHNRIAFGYPCDVAQESQVEEFVRQIRARTRHVDALIQCAGRFGAIGAVLQTESQEWLRTIETNLFGAYLMVKHVGPLMEGPPRPRIINFAGGGAFSPFEHYSAYAVSKTALVRLTEILAIELASRDIAVNGIAPGFVATEIHEATLREGPARAGQAFFEQTVHMLRHGAVPMEVPIACVKFLLSDQAAPLTGKTISASFDPWGAAAFVELIPRLNASDVYTLRRINPVNVPEASLREALATAGQQQQQQQQQQHHPPHTPAPHLSGSPGRS